MAERSVMIGRRSGQVLVQDLVRPGYAHLGVGTSGAADRESLKLANRLVGNDESSACLEVALGGLEDRKSTRLNSSHVSISYAVFCLKKKNDNINREIS